MNLDYEIILLYYLLGAIINYLGGLYGIFEVNWLLIFSGMSMKFYSIFLLIIKLRDNEKGGNKK